MPGKGWLLGGGNLNKLQRVFVIATLALSFVLPAQVDGVQFPWVTPANSQVFIVTDSRVDFALRIAAIDRAQHTIESATFFQGIDERIGMPVLQAFRRAQNRGVTGRYIQERVSTIKSDFWNVAARMLDDANLKEPGQVVSFGGWRNWFHGLRLTDFVHEKILILDAGTPHETIFISGRNNADHAVANIDLTIVIRPLVPGRPWIGDQIKLAFGTLWDFVKTIYKPRTPKARKRFIPPPDKNVEVALLNDRQRAEFAELNELLSRPPVAGAPLKDFEARPESMRVLTNDLLIKAITNKYSRRLSRRYHYQSDIIHAASPTIAGSKRVFASMMSVTMPAELKQALIAALKNGAEVHLVTNSRETNKTYTPFGLGFDYSLTDIIDLMEIGGNLSVYILDEKLLLQHEDLYHLVTYVHRKLVVADNHVFSGSDNYNATSSANNSEIVVESIDQAFADKMVEVMRNDLQVFSMLTCETALKEHGRFNLIKRGLNRLFIPFY